MPKLRPFQQKLVADIYAAWQGGARNVMPVSATGSGKTVVVSHILTNNPGPSIAIAHRQELISQISLAMARNEVRHRIIGPDNVAKICRQIQLAELGYHFVDPNARCGVAGVDSLIRISDDDPYYRDWFKSVTLQMQDEAHHVLKENKWGQAAAKFPNAWGVFPTATPIRADGRGLGRHADGLMDALIEAPTMREIINMGYLTDYRIFAPPSDLDLATVEVGASGEFKQHQLSAAVRKSHLVGDVVGHYTRIAKGKLGVTFATDVEEATKIAAEFRAAGVPAEVVSAKTPDTLRADILRRFRTRQVLQLVNVDLFGEGFDLPAIEVVSFARATASFSLYCQQFGRALRLMLDRQYADHWDDYSNQERKTLIAQSSKPNAIIIDHVGNVVRHGLPDAFREWSLDRRERRGSGKSDAIPLKSCAGCTQPYPRTNKTCPWCGHYTPPAERTGPIFVDGDLTELDPSVLANMRGEIERIDGAPNVSPYGDAIVGAAIRKNHTARQQAQSALRDAMAWFRGLDIQRGVQDVSEQYRRFYFKFGIDVATAHTLNEKDAFELREKIISECLKFGIDASVTSSVVLNAIPGEVEL
jgi:DNA repair protein RadD